MTYPMWTTEPKTSQPMRAVVGVGVCLLHVLALWVVWRATLPSHPHPLRESRRMEMVYIRSLAPTPVPPLKAPADGMKPLAPNRNPVTQALRAVPKAPSTAMTWPSPQPPTPVDAHEAQDVAADASREQGSIPSTKPGSSDLVLTLPSGKDWSPRQRSYAELANEQMNAGERRDGLAEGIKSAAIPDCLRDDQGGGLLGLPITVYKAATGKCKK